MDDEPEEGVGEEKSDRRHRAGRRTGISLTETLGRGLKRLSFRTPVHSLRLRGRYPLQLLDVPADPIPGSVRAGRALLDGKMLAAGRAYRSKRSTAAVSRRPSRTIGRASPGCATWRHRSNGVARRRSRNG
jgi:hypothetical protein